MKSRTSRHSAAPSNGRDKEFAALLARAQSAEDALEALRSGTADAIVANGPTGPILTFAGSEHPYRAMVEAMSEGAVTVTVDGTILYCNQRFAKMVKADQKTIIGSSLPARFADAGAATIGNAILRSRDRGSRKRAILLALDGARVPVNVAMHRLAERESRYVVIVISDLTDVATAEAALAESELRLRTVMDTNVDGIVMVDVETTKFLYANRAFRNQLGYAVDEISALGLADIYPPDVLSGIWRNFKSPPDSAAGGAKNIPTKRKDGSILFMDIAASPAMLAGRQYLVTCFHDVTERKAAEEKLTAMARYDLLTGLANRSVFVGALDRAIALARRGGRSFAVLFLDLDHFKDVNDTLGHPIGDLLLRAVADRLQATARASDTIARFGGDEFGILLPDIDDPAHAAAVASRVREALAETIAVEQAAGAAGNVADKLLRRCGEPFSIQGNDIHIGASVGIAVYGADSIDAETMLSRADVALYRAKSEGRGTYRFFDTAMETEVRARVALGTELRLAIASDQLFLIYQPQVDDETDQVVGLEALVRWNHPTRGIVGPALFIPEAERNGLIVPLGNWVLLEASRQAKKWLDAGIAPTTVGVNLSAMQFKNSGDLEKSIASTLAATGLPPSFLELELTESVLMAASVRHNEVLLRFRAAGYHIAIDDFGSGYSSLAYLSRFPVDRIKVAQSFVCDLPTNPRNQAIVKAAIGLAHELGLRVVVEGVETAEQLAMIRSWGCRLIQGFYFSKPLPVDEMTALLRIGKITRPAARPVIDFPTPSFLEPACADGSDPLARTCARDRAF